MESIYPPGPQSVPQDLTKASSKYRRHAWLAVAGLMLFVLVYFALAAWFAYSAYQIILETSAGYREPFIGYLVGGCSAFLGIFMIKALFFVKHSGENSDHEVTAENEPRLFDFLHRLADEAGAPRPHRVFLSPRVNACVFYDLSILNFFFSSKKNLEIGLPLVNALNLGELKAVLAHEFGHFAQKSMAVGRWVYISQQIAGHIVAKRDFLDSFLSGLSRFDIRIAWIGWLLSLIVWSLRALMDSIFSIVVIAQRALSREMEFQADLVAVSLTGSDALVHALYKLQAADDSWDRTLKFVNSEVTAGRSVADMFLVQNRITNKMREILDDPDYGNAKAVPDTNPESYRLFKDQIAQPPKMWATHPENNEREDNAKRVYIFAPISDESAWDLFQNAEQLKLDISAQMLKEIECKQASHEDTLNNLDEYYGYRFLSPQYKGAYLGRELTRYAESVNELVDKSNQATVDQLLALLYPKQLKQQLKKLRQLQEETAVLRALRDGLMKAAGGVINHNGKEYHRKDLDQLIVEQKQAIAEIENWIHQQDRNCRTAHWRAAKIMGQGWDDYLLGLMSVLHYAEHSLAQLEDVRGAYNNVLAVVLADGKVSSRELNRLVNIGSEACTVMGEIYDQASQVQLDTSLLKRLEIESWEAGLGDYGLPYPNNENINDWVQAVDSWFDSLTNAMSALRTQALEQLLVSESYIGHKYQNSDNAPMQYGVTKVPTKYRRLLPGNERKLQTRLGLWDRFQTADGVLGAFSRILVAGSIIGAVLWYGFKVVIFNDMSL